MAIDWKTKPFDINLKPIMSNLANGRHDIVTLS